MAHPDCRQVDAASHGAFAMDPESTLRLLARRLVVSQQEMADLERNAATVRALGSDNARRTNLLAEWEYLHRRWVTMRLPSLTAAMKLALEVYDTFGPGMTRVDDPIEAGIWNNKYFVWGRELSPASMERDERS